MDRFKKEFSSTRCKEVVKHQFGRYYDFHNPEDQKQFVAVSMKTGKCMEVIKKAVLIRRRYYFRKFLNPRTISYDDVWCRWDW